MPATFDRAMPTLSAMLAAERENSLRRGGTLSAIRAKPFT